MNSAAGNAGTVHPLVRTERGSLQLRVLSAVTLAQIATALSPGQPLPEGIDEYGLEGTDIFHPENNTFAYGVHVATVEVDIETGLVRPLRHVVVNDSGRVINPLILEGQIEGGVAQGVGGAFYERLAYDEEGQLRNASFMEFLMPYATEIPDVEMHHIETPSPLNPLGIKGAGEAGTIPVAARLAQWERAFVDVPGNGIVHPFSSQCSCGSNLSPSRYRRIGGHMPARPLVAGASNHCSGSFARTRRFLRSAELNTCPECGY